MKTYFEYNGFKVQDYKDKEFAKYEVSGTNKCFDDIAEAILYCIGKAEGDSNESQLSVHIDTFLTMVRK